MNSPTHVMAGALVAQTMMIYRDRHPQRWVAIVSGAAAFALGTVSHLLLDALPHNDWIAVLNWFPGLPYHGLWCEAVWALPVAIIGAYAGRDHPLILWFGVLGGMYPDFEKVAFTDFHMPLRFVVFRSHSLKMSSNDGGWPLAHLVALETALLLGMAVATLVIAHWRQRRLETGDRESPLGF